MDNTQQVKCTQKSGVKNGQRFAEPASFESVYDSSRCVCVCVYSNKAPHEEAHVLNQELVTMRGLTGTVCLSE